MEPRTWHRARDLYEEAVAQDDEYAPAWARLGRLYRVMGKYASGPDPAGDFDRAAAAVQRALSLDPELPMAVLYGAQLDLELGRSREALVRLLERAHRHPSDPYLLAGLVQACRYCGLVEASVAAHEHVRRLDRVMPTGVVHTFWLKGDFERALEHSRSFGEGFDGLVLAMMGREEEAIASLERDEARFSGSLEADFCRLMRFALQQNAEEARLLATHFTSSLTFVDPEGIFHGARVYARIGDVDDAIRLLERVSDNGFCGLPAMTRDPWLDTLRGRGDFRAILDRADASLRAAAAAFRSAGGERVLGVPAR
jgi:tetratricopeptide (TPR) repeat protein